MESIQLALLSFACTLASAAQSPPAQFAGRTALIIGISTYSNPEISSLPGVAADRLMAEGKGPSRLAAYQNPSESISILNVSRGI